MIERMREELRVAQLMVGVYEDVLQRLNLVGPESEEAEDLAAFGEVKDGLMEELERYRRRSDRLKTKIYRAGGYR